jgi:hypothetical protein
MPSTAAAAAALPVSPNKFYTSKETVDICYKAIKKYAKIKKTDFIIEPSAGDGAFIEKIKKLSKYHMFYDIKPENPEIARQNFLSVKSLPHINSAPRDIHIIGNPPFGNKSSMAIKFIKHSAFLKAKTISFILPNSFQKPSFIKSFPLNYHLIYQHVFHQDTFLHNGKPENVNTIFQIWERRNMERKRPAILVPAVWYEFVKRPLCNIAIKRVGFSTGTAKICKKNDNTNTNWFIKTRKKPDAKLLTRLNAIKYDTKKNVGAYSISKQEIIKAYNRVRR